MIILHIADTDGHTARLIADYIMQLLRHHASLSELWRVRVLSIFTSASGFLSTLSFKSKEIMRLLGRRIAFDADSDIIWHYHHHRYHITHMPWTFSVVWESYWLKLRWSFPRPCNNEHAWQMQYHFNLTFTLVFENFAWPGFNSYPFIRVSSSLL